LKTDTVDDVKRWTPAAAFGLAAVLSAGACGGTSSHGTAQNAPGTTASRPTTPSTSPSAVVPTFNSAHLLAGTAKPTFSAGAAGKIDTVYVGKILRDPSGSAELPIVLRNNTQHAISHIDATATARNSAGALIATGQSQETDPAQLAPGEAALSFIYFQIGTAPVPDTATFGFTFETIAADTSSYNTATAKVTEANLSGGSIVGTATNATRASMQGPYSVNVYCFDAAGAIVDTSGGFADQNANVAPGGNLTFTVSLYGRACPNFLVGVTGFFA